MSYFLATATFGYQHSGPTDQNWYTTPRPMSNDAWNFYQSLTPLGEKAKQYFGEDNFFWQELVEHSSYDEFWQKRSILPHLHDVKTNVMVVGGLFDAEDLYGPLHIYQELEKNNPNIHNCIVMGPWSHGDWARPSKYALVGNMPFGENIAASYERDIEAPFFRYYLKDEGEEPNFEAMIFDTGLREWKTFDAWPPREAQAGILALNGDKSLGIDQAKSDDPEFQEFVSDPANPVPYRDRELIEMRFTPRPYMSDNQKFATFRDDVLTFTTDVLTEPVTVAGDITGELFVSTDKTDADWIVKLIDVYPDNHPQLPGTPNGITLAGYQQMVRGDVIRGRFRNSFEKPEPFTPGEVTKVNVPLQDVLHTFTPGHRIMVQVQSSWFPLIDLNPQTYVENIFKAKAEDFVPATHRVYHDDEHSSQLKIRFLKN
ncbi:MAG: CocE/NonD family hydrolase [Pirellulaceae bacterium]